MIKQEQSVALTGLGVHVSMIPFDFSNVPAREYLAPGGGKSYPNFKEDVA